MLLRLTLEDSFDDNKIIVSITMVEGEVVRVGRCADMDLMLPDVSRFTSRCHCEIRHGAEGFEILDHSANGTLVNGRPTGEGRQILADGDRLAIERYVIVVAIEAIGGGSDQKAVISCGTMEPTSHTSALAGAALRRRGGDPAEMAAAVARRLAELDGLAELPSQDWTQILPA